MMTRAGLEQALWALGRGAGVTSLVLITVSVVLGIVTRSGRPLPGLPRFGVTELHRITALLGTGLVVLHMVTLLADPYAQLRVVDFVVPFLGAYRPVWLGLGTLAVDLLLVILVTSLLRHRLGLRAFRAVHWTTYGLWPIALAHGLGNGTDAGHAWFLILAATCTLAVLTVIAWRLSRNFVEYDEARTRGQLTGRW
ncbi:MAG: ferric reductase-like transmembrane domain-containing protein [Mycobacteriaceae bacterium]